ALRYEQIVEQWIDAARKQSDENTDLRVLRDRLALALASEWPAKVASERRGEKIALSREGKGDRVPGIWVESGKPAVLIVDAAGAEAARRTSAAQDAIRRGESILMIDAFQTGSAVAPRNRAVKHFLALNQTDDACRAQDIITALAFLKQSGHETIRLVASGKAAVWSQFAAAVAGVPVKLELDLAGFSGSDQEFVDSFFVPGIQRAGGLKAAKRVLER